MFFGDYFGKTSTTNVRLILLMIGMRNSCNVFARVVFSGHGIIFPALSGVVALQPQDGHLLDSVSVRLVGAPVTGQCRFNRGIHRAASSGGNVHHRMLASFNDERLSAGEYHHHPSRRPGTSVDRYVIPAVYRYPRCPGVAGRVRHAGGNRPVAEERLSG